MSAKLKLNGIGIGDEVRVVSEYPDGPSEKDEMVGYITELGGDPKEDTYPYRVMLNLDNRDIPIWIHSVELLDAESQPEPESEPVVIPLDRLSEILVRNGASAKLAVELVVFLGSHNAVVRSAY